MQVSITQHAAALRLREVGLMVGFPLAGSAFAAHSLDWAIVLRICVFAAGIGLLFVAVYAFNAFSGAEMDAHNPRLSPLGRFSPRYYLAHSALALLAGCAVLAPLEIWFVAAAVGSFGAWALYSWPARGWKERAWLGSLVHFVTQALHVAMGWAAVRGVESETWFVAAYFAALFSAGHLHHQAVDFESDRDAGVLTLAVSMGRKRVLRYSVIAFTVATLYWAVLYVLRVIEVSAFLPFLGAFGAYAAATYQAAKGNWLYTTAGALRLRDRYRLFYFIAGMAFLLLRTLSTPC